MSERLKLRASDRRDLEMIASVIQDALVPLSDMAYLPGERRFVLLLNRFRWEAVRADSEEIDPLAPAKAGSTAMDVSFADQPASPFERVHSALVFDRVRAVKRRGLENAARAGLVEILTVSLEGSHVLLAFSGNAAVRLDVDQLSCHLEDLGEPWPTLWRPRHSERETPGGSR
jgi:Protein of unknown function (DUF2948)